VKPASDSPAADAAIPKDLDAIVVGTGPGGATVARELSRRGKKVLVLEWGKGGPVRGTLGQFLSELMLPGRSLLLTRELLGMVRGITTGGSSLFYYGTAFPVPLEMLAAHGVDLTAEAQELRQELPVGPLKDAMMTPMATRLMESARRLGFAWNKLDKLLDQNRWRPGMRFGYYGDPNGVKWSARMYVDDAVRHGARLLNGARVHRVLVEGDVATGVELSLGGKRHTASAQTVVIAAGGIGSPLILRKTGVREAGYDFFFDPLITVCGAIEGMSLCDAEIPMSAGVHMKAEGYLMTDMPLPAPLHAVFAVGALRPTSLLAARSTARIMVKIKDELSGGLSGRGGVRKGLTGADHDKLLHGYANARRILREAGARDIYKTWYLAAHPGGTVKIGECVDADLQTRYRNLYVCDCSVIPEAWGLPPVMTVLALGKRLARHILAAGVACSGAGGASSDAGSQKPRVTAA
jgi:choline dehydrogenase-like flavoprotein